MIVLDRIISLIEPSLMAMGYELVRIQFTGSNRKTLQIMVDRLDGMGMDVEHCADISHTVSAVLDVEDPISNAYSLEITSPGIDRPLTKISHFKRFVGFDAKIELYQAVNNRKRYTGQIDTIDGSQIALLLNDETKNTSVFFEFSDIRSAKLIITDALLTAAQSGQLPGIPVTGKTNNILEKNKIEPA